MTKANHIAMCLFGLLILTGLILTCASSNWVHSSSNSVSFNSRKEYKQQGLWLECTELTQSGSSQCTKLFQSFKISRIPAYLNYSRFVIVISIVLVLIATICSILGNPLLSCFKAQKKIITFITAGTFFISGILSIIAYSWYTNAAMNNYITDMGQKLNNRQISQWDLGWAMYIGFVTSIFAILGSVHAVVVAAKMKNSYVVETYEADMTEYTAPIKTFAAEPVEENEMAEQSFAGNLPSTYI